MAKSALKTRKKGEITYSFATPYDTKKQILYVNVVPKFNCVNSCRFCSRNRAVAGKENIYESKARANLYLPKAPTVKEVVEAVKASRKKGLVDRTKEIAFVGLGEPLLQFELVRGSIAGIRNAGYKGKIRVDTNGLVKCWYGPAVFGCLEKFNNKNPARELKKAGLNEARISVNAISEKEYQELCRPSYENAFEKLCEFVKDCRREGIRTRTSFVVDFDDGEVRTRPAEDYRQFARSLGIKAKDIILRKYVPSRR